MITAARKIDEIIGYSVAPAHGKTKQIVQSVLELSGTPTPYNDLNNVPLTSYNQNFVQRTVVRFELGMFIGKLEEARASRSNLNASDQKRISAGLQLEIQRNATGFYGYNNGLNVTYGFLNDPNLPAYVAVATVGQRDLGAENLPANSGRSFDCVPKPAYPVPGHDRAR